MAASVRKYAKKSATIAIAKPASVASPALPAGVPDAWQRAGMRAVVLESRRRRRLPPRVAVAMLLVACPDPAVVAGFLKQQRQTRQIVAWRRVIARHGTGCGIIAKLLENRAVEPLRDDLASVIELFDRAAAIDPVAAMALHSLGDAGELERGSVEVMRWLKQRRLLGKNRRLLDLGCGIGRMLPVLAPHCARVDGVEPVAALARHARKHCRDLANVEIHRTDGRDLAKFPDGSCDIILAIDSFPYLVAAHLADLHVAESARVLAPGGDLVIINWSYDHDAATDRAVVRDLAERHGFRVLRCGGRPFTTWDGELFHLRKRRR